MEAQICALQSISALKAFAACKKDWAQISCPKAALWVDISNTEAIRLYLFKYATFVPIFDTNRQRCIS